MKRLTYAPKAYVFIRSNTQGGKVYNLSPDVVSGQLERNVNDLSTASIVVRNRFRKWLKDPQNGKSLFLPMDMITIWLQRIAGKPIQQFTGYIDSVTGYQLYPGNMEITASCTLKKLNNQYFDPGLAWFQNWLSSLNGWIIDPGTGIAQNPTLTTIQGQNSPVNDGGFSQLIYEFVVQVCGWNPDSVIVSDINPDIPKIASKLYARITDENVAMERAFEEVMSNIIGITATPTAGLSPGGALSHRQDSVTRDIVKVAAQVNIPAKVFMVSALLATNFKVGYSVTEDSSTGQNEWGYGIYAMKPTTTGRLHSTTEAQQIDGVDKNKLTNVQTATQVYAKRLKTVNSPVSAQARQHNAGRFDQAKTNNKVLKDWIEAALNRTFDQADFQRKITEAENMMRAYSYKTDSSSSEPQPTNKNLPPHLGWTSADVTGAMDANDLAVWRRYYSKSNDSLAPYFWIAKTHFNGINLAKPTEHSENVLHLTGGNSELSSLFDMVKIHTEFDSITYTQAMGNTDTIQTWRNGRRSSLIRVPAGGSSRPVSGSVAIEVNRFAPYPNWDGQHAENPRSSRGQTDPQNGMPQGGMSFTGEDLGKIGFASAFAANFTFPIDAVSSRTLTGYKALANDLQVMEGVQQFCQSSLRSFMSLPDGRFCAFYPDYFGAHGRRPYWNVYDIEITNAGVVFNDEQLATHVYTIGDVANADGTVNFIDYYSSAGVVTLDMVGILDSFIRPLTGTGDNIKSMGNRQLGELKTAADFMYHYGARVYKEEIPMIRNTYYEFLYAWQRFMQKWAATFQTTVEFTFQPEVMVGGIIGFPQHNLQMYVEQVTHTWDYSSGFTTEARMSAPAAIDQHNRGDIGSLPGFALAGNTVTIGAASS